MIFWCFSVCHIWVLKKSYDVITKNVSGIEKPSEKIILYIFTSNLHLLSQSV